MHSRVCSALTDEMATGREGGTRIESPGCIHVEACAATSALSVDVAASIVGRFFAFRAQQAARRSKKAVPLKRQGPLGIAGRSPLITRAGISKFDRLAKGDSDVRHSHMTTPRENTDKGERK
jgi:hypothetical protein